MSMDDIFSMFGDIFGGHGGFGGFGGGGGQTRQRKFRGSDLRVKVKLNLKEISTGVEKKFKLKKYVQCSHCHGTGAEGDGGVETCPTCHGTGSVTRTQQSIFGMMQTQTVCPQCGGEGKIIKNKCKECGGEGIVYGEEVVTVKIPAGIDENQTIVLKGEGETGYKGGPKGDLYITIHIKKHNIYTRKGNNVICEIPITFTQAALGAELEIPMVDGTIEKYTIPEGTQSETKFTIRNKGFKNINNNFYGDFIFVVQVQVPKRLSKEQREILLQLAKTMNEQPPIKKKGIFG
jgi:molecular chaperone DnaJ